MWDHALEKHPQGNLDHKDFKFTIVNSQPTQEALLEGLQQVHCSKQSQGSTLKAGA